MRLSLVILLQFGITLTFIGTHAILSDELSLDTSSLLISSNSNTFLIANPHDTFSFPLSSMNESLVVQAASPMNEQLVVGGVSGLDVSVCFYLNLCCR